jgi:hypothetical protein
MRARTEADLCVGTALLLPDLCYSGSRHRADAGHRSALSVVPTDSSARRSIMIETLDIDG